MHNVDCTDFIPAGDGYRKPCVSTSQEFLLPSEMGADDLLARVKQEFRHHAEPPRMLQRTWYDSFDWRLYANNSTLEDTRDGNEHTLVWRTLKGNQGDARLKLKKAPRFAWDLPPGHFRERLEPVLEMRELSPKLRIRSRVNTLRILQQG